MLCMPRTVHTEAPGRGVWEALAFGEVELGKTKNGEDKHERKAEVEPPCLADSIPLHVNYL
jgi:hypothetical protein